MGKKGPGNIDHKGRGTKLVHEHGFGHDRQPQGHDIGVGGSKTVRKESGYSRADHQADLMKQRYGK